MQTEFTWARMICRRGPKACREQDNRHLHACDRGSAPRGGRGCGLYWRRPCISNESKVDVVDPVTTAYVREVATEIRLPFVAIGGIKYNVDEVLVAGARRICAISEIVGSADVRGTCQQFLEKINRYQGG